MKAARKIGIAVWSLVALLLAGILIVGITSGPQFLTNKFVFYSGYGLNDENTKIAGEYSIEAADIEKIKLNWKSGLIRISTHDGDDIKIVERVMNNSKEYDKLTYDVISGNLTIESNAGSEWYFLSYGPVQKIIDLKIPQNSSDLLEDIIINSQSADVAVNGISAEALQAETTSGDVKIVSSKIDSYKISVTSGDITFDEPMGYTDKEISNLQAGSTSGYINLYSCKVNSVKLSSTSGDLTCENITTGSSVELSCTSGYIKMSNCDTSDLSLSTTSGDVSADLITADLIKISTASGDIKLNADAKKINCSSSSGDITADGKIYNVDFDSASGDIRVKSSVDIAEVNGSTSSGDIHLYIPADKSNGFTAVYDTNSGDFYSNLEMASNNSDRQHIYGNGKNIYNIKSSSGDLTINSN